MFMYLFIYIRWWYMLTCCNMNTTLDPNNSCHRPRVATSNNDWNGNTRYQRKEWDSEHRDNPSKLLHDWIIILLIQLNGIEARPEYKYRDAFGLFMDSFVFRDTKLDGTFQLLSRGYQCLYGHYIFSTIMLYICCPENDSLT